jgi:FkbM family methyltransferase
MKDVLKTALRHTPYRVIRSHDSNRFQAIEETLVSLRGRKFAPKIVIDGGANVGNFARIARRVFGADLEIHLFEPQPACLQALEAYAKQPGIHLHPVALASRDGETLNLVIDSDTVTTGAHVAPSPSDGDSIVSVPAVTLDSVFAQSLKGEDRALCKLDLQGWELEALKGAIGTLSRIEVVLIEVSFFRQGYEPSIAELVHFMDESGLDLHDIASLSARRRDNRAHQSDFVFVNRTSPLVADTVWG